jgi:hypothetical protein
MIRRGETSKYESMSKLTQTQIKIKLNEIDDLLKSIEISKQDFAEKLKFNQINCEEDSIQTLKSKTELDLIFFNFRNIKITQ